MDIPGDSGGKNGNRMDEFCCPHSTAIQAIAQLRHRLRPPGVLVPADDWHRQRSEKRAKVTETQDRRSNGWNLERHPEIRRRHAFFPFRRAFLPPRLSFFPFRRAFLQQRLSFFPFRRAFSRQRLSFFPLRHAFLPQRLSFFPLRHAFLRQRLSFFPFRRAFLRRRLSFFPFRRAFLRRRLSFFQLRRAFLRRRLSFFPFRHAFLRRRLSFFQLRRAWEGLGARCRKRVSHLRWSDGANHRSFGKTTPGCNAWSIDRQSPLSHVPIAPPARATRPRPPGVLVGWSAAVNGRI
jgi:hypothetical protein